ncbi:uncharacterized protein MELLADRAFT_94455 [Melampsora larici-populina 98AG31]|uniref:HMG box domain-containing protein n=1 Tax=Melampsora larici-populina (strain 98AG31 / pathotype 3-4-7) TaxID=747676 RepID=F4RB26_MELLP|nr:uncharacterized protein MELLADRAFT_94455 [Melampsora larici-populina 98AG31]EGG10337.1 hypothetical protein MELLADRAFT_94455 [Melampsora larici-populina 98AG31]
MVPESIHVGRSTFGTRQTTEASLATGPFPSQELDSTCVAGQFSDAESDEDPAQSDAKRQRVDDNTQNARLIPGNTLRQDSSMNGLVVSGITASHSTQSVDTQNIPFPSSQIYSQATRDSSNLDSEPAMPTASQTFVRSASMAQLPSAVRRLAALVGIPESSQAIIQSTLPTLFKRPTSSASSMANDRRSISGLERHGSNLFVPARSSSVIPDHYLRALTELQPTTRMTNTLSEVQRRVLLSSLQVPTEPPTKGLQGHVSQSSIHAETVPASYAPAVTSAPTIPSNITHLSPALLDSSSLISTKPTLLPSPDIDPIFSAPKFGESSSEPGGFTMPARGTFSIPAPSSIGDLQALHCDSPSAIEDPTTPHCSQGDQFGESSAQPSEISKPTESVIEQLTPSEAPSQSTRKRKSRASKVKAESQNDESVNAEPKVELVKPPPTINGKISHGRKVPVGYVKRTPNSFIMFRSHVIANKLLPPGVENDNRQISRVVSGLWAGLSEDDLRTWQTASRELRAAARAKNPEIKHPPNQKRKDIIRRKRSGQLPGETPEQRVEREKARAAALAKVIIDARGERLDKDKLVQLAGISLPQQQLAGSSRTRDSSREASRPEFRAPASLGVQLDAIASSTLSECAGSVLTTSPRPNARGMLSPMPESVNEDLTESTFPILKPGAKSKTKRASRASKSSSTQQKADGAQPTPKPRSSRKASESRCANEQTREESVPALTVESTTGTQTTISSASAEQCESNKIDLAAFSSMFDCLSDHIGSSTFPDCFPPDMFESLGLATSGPSNVPSTGPSSSETAKDNVIDPKILNMSSAPAVTVNNQSTGGFWSNPTESQGMGPPDSNFMSSGGYALSGSDQNQSSALNEGRQDEFPSFDMLSQLVSSDHLDLSQFIGHRYASQPQSNLSSTDFDLSSLYLGNGNSSDSTVSHLHPFSHSGIAGAGTGTSFTASQDHNPFENLQAPNDSESLENWGWSQLGNS